MPPSCRFLDNGRVVYADGVGKLTCFLAEREFPFKWNVNNFNIFCFYNNYQKKYLASNDFLSSIKF